MNHTEALKAIAENGKDLAAYTESQREAVKRYGWEKYGYGFADTVRIETTTFDRDSYLDAIFM